MTDTRSPAVAGVAMAMMQKEKEVRLWFFIPTELFMLTVVTAGGYEEADGIASSTATASSVQ